MNAYTIYFSRVFFPFSQRELDEIKYKSIRILDMLICLETLVLSVHIVSSCVLKLHSNGANDLDSYLFEIFLPYFYALNMLGSKFG